MNLSDAEARMVREALKDGLLSATADCDSSHERSIEAALAMLDAKAGEGRADEVCSRCGSIGWHTCHGKPNQGERAATKREAATAQSIRGTSEV